MIYGGRVPAVTMCAVPAHETAGDSRWLQGSTMIDHQPVHSLADDPDFRASLVDLDRGLRSEPPAVPPGGGRPVLGGVLGVFARGPRADPAGAPAGAGPPTRWGTPPGVRAPPAPSPGASSRSSTAVLE